VLAHIIQAISIRQPTETHTSLVAMERPDSRSHNRDTSDEVSHLPWKKAHFRELWDFPSISMASVTFVKAYGVFPICFCKTLSFTVCHISMLNISYWRVLLTSYFTQQTGWLLWWVMMIKWLCITSTEKHSSVNSYITPWDKGRQGPWNFCEFS